MEDYRIGKGSKWTKVNKFIKVEEIIPHGNEKIITLKYMKKYGYNNVRGYTWSQTKEFSPKQIKNLEEKYNLLKKDFRI